MNILTILKFLFGLKFGWIILIIIGVILIFSILKNIISGSFSTLKFASEFNLFSGPVQAKLIYYGFLAILAFGLYHQLTRATYDTDYTNTYKNNVHHNDEVTIDQSQHIQTPEDILVIGIKIFGLKIGITAQSKPQPITIIDNTKTQAPTESIIVVPEKTKELIIKKTTIMGKIFKIIGFPFTLLKKIGR